MGGLPELPRIDSRTAGSSRDGVAILRGTRAVMRAHRQHVLAKQQRPDRRKASILDYFGAGWKLGGATLLREARRTGLGDDSTRGGASLEDAGGRPGQKVDWGLACGGAMADGASLRGKMRLMASVCFLYC